MAATDSIRTNLNALEEALLQATTIAMCLSEATTWQTDADPKLPWVSLFVHWVHEINNAGQNVIEDVNLKCLPLLNDMAKVNARS